MGFPAGGEGRRGVRLVSGAWMLMLCSSVERTKARWRRGRQRGADQVYGLDSNFLRKPIRSLSRGARRGK
jgi:hypothetical protein